MFLPPLPTHRAYLCSPRGKGLLGSLAPPGAEAPAAALVIPTKDSRDTDLPAAPHRAQEGVQEGGVHVVWAKPSRGVQPVHRLGDTRVRHPCSKERVRPLTCAPMCVLTWHEPVPPYPVHVRCERGGRQGAKIAGRLSKMKGGAERA